MRRSLHLCAATIILAFCFALPARADDAKSGIDWDRARTLFERQQKGETLSVDDQAYLDKAQKEREQPAQKGQPAAGKRGEQPPAQGGGAMSEADMTRVRELYKKMKNGEKLSPEDQAFMDKVKAGGVRAPAEGGKRAAKGDKPAGDIDWERAKALHEREQNGEKLSAEDQAYLEKARASRGQGPAGGDRPKGRDGIDMERVKAIYQRQQNGEKLSAEDQAYLDKAKASQGQGRARGEGAPQKGANASGIDWDRARKLHQQEQNGEKLSAEDQAYLDKAKAALHNGQGPGAGGGGNGGGENKGGGRNSGPPAGGKTSVDITPLTDLAKGEKYKDQDGGLYGNGENTPPAVQLKLAQAAVAAIKPLDASGAASAEGKIVLMSVGMSNTTMEFSKFKQIADADSRKAANLVVVDGAQGGKDAAAWVNSEPVWETAKSRLAAAGVTPQQVQIIWIKQALMGPAKHGEFPKHAEDLKQDVEHILLLAKKHYPNVKLAYLSSRIYAGFAGTPLNPEPYAYEGAFSMRWVIQDQMKPGSSINADPALGEVKAPVALWGPYLWANGDKGRKIDSLVYTREDLGGDGTHPSESARQKVADRLLNFFTSDETAKPWFVKK